jgi:hypothetical protein
MLFYFDATVEGRISSSVKHLDRHIDANLKKHNIKPSPEASDAEFLRRVSLDLTGKIPTVEEVVKFLEDGSKDKREKKINELIGGERYLDYWTGLWMRWLVGQGDANADRRMGLESWVRSSLAQNMPYDLFVKALLAAKGDIRENGAGNFVQYYDLSPVDLTAHISRLFLGLPMQCAQCHDHKTEPWYQRDFYGFAAFFANMQSEPVYEADGMGGNRLASYVLKDVSEGSISMPDTYEPIPPRFLDGGACKESPTKRREALADWMTDKDNPYFSRAIVNRIWAHFMGRGFVEPLDGFGEEHPPTMPELLDWLAEDFVIHGYDLQYFVRTILNSRAYQRSSEANKSNQNDEIYYSRTYVKPLTAEQFFYSMLEATGFERLQSRRDRNQLEGMRRQYLERFIFLLGNGEREEVEAFNGTVPQALMMINGSLVNDSGSHKERGSLINYILKTQSAKRERLDQIYLTILSRYPTTEERAYFDRYLRSSLYRNEALAYEDLYWSLLNSAEFALNH